MPMPEISVLDFVGLGAIANVFADRRHQTIDDVVNDSDLKDIGVNWKPAPTSNGQGQIFFAVLSGHKDTGEIRVLVVMADGARAPFHRHVRGEYIAVLKGLLVDVDDDGKNVNVGHGGSTVHGWDTRHAPSGQAQGLTVVWYDQPGGSELLPEP